jgi:TPP-dependent pyruvate/acetoin dehydrogenase alpha subunit
LGSSVLFVCENNPLWERRLDTPFSDPNWKKGAAYGIEAEAVDGMNLMAVIDAADTAVQKWEVLENLIYWFAIPIVLRHTRCLMPNYIGTKRDWRMEKRDPIPTFKITC